VRADTTANFDSANDSSYSSNAIAAAGEDTDCHSLA
jgi:hypothetical protein